MALISSPVTYPATSSPVEDATRSKDRRDPPRKRRKLSDSLEEIREPLKAIQHNLSRAGLFECAPLSEKSKRMVGGFVVDDDSDADDGDAYEESESLHPLVLNAEAPFKDVDTNLCSDKKSSGREPEGQKEHDPLREGFRFPDQYNRNSHIKVQTCKGKEIKLSQKAIIKALHYERVVAARSIVVEGRAQKSYYGIDIHRLIEDAHRSSENSEASHGPEQALRPTIETVAPNSVPARRQLWTEKYRARKFTDLIGDERTHRSVLRWLKGWDTIVFPNQARPKPKIRPQQDQENERAHRKLLLLTGPPGLGKTTLAHVCAKQAGYEVQEINASDERSRDVVRGRIRDMVATENVKMVNSETNNKKAARPVCVVVDEVDGVVGGSNGGEGGFIKALTDLISLDQRNSAAKTSATGITKKRKGDNFRMLRPLILICNDAYHPSLRLLRNNSMAEIVHVRKPALNMIIPRLQNIFGKEGLQCDSEGVRKLCEATWGVSSRREDKAAAGTVDGDIRGILVVGEWVASKLRAEKLSSGEARLTKGWLETHVLGTLAQGGGAARSLGRGGTKEVLDRLFIHNAGFPLSSNTKVNTSEDAVAGTVTQPEKTSTMINLRQLIEVCGDEERIMTDCFTTYPSHPFQDDTILTRPNTAYEWLHFHDELSTRVHHSQEWDLMPYLSHPPLAFHHLFASPTKYASATNANKEAFPEENDQAGSTSSVRPFSTIRAPFEAHEMEKENRSILTTLHSTLSTNLHRAFRSPAHLAEELIPYLIRLVSPDVKPVIIGGMAGVASVRRGAEKDMVNRAVEGMIASGLKFERGRVDFGEANPTGPTANGGMVYRMEPALDEVSVFATMDGSVPTVPKARYSVRQVLEQEWKREVGRRAHEASLRRTNGARDENMTSLHGTASSMNKEASRIEAKDQNVAALQKSAVAKKDFFGRPLVTRTSAGDGVAEGSTGLSETTSSSEDVNGKEEKHGRIWVTYHEGYSNAVRKGITLKELMEGL